LLNPRRKTETGVCEIKFNDVKVTSTDDILRGWCEYFSDLYSVSEDKDFDSEHRRTIEAMTTNFTNPQLPCYDPSIEPATLPELKKILQSLPNGKSGSLDNVTYEHLKYGVKIYKSI